MLKPCQHNQAQYDNRRVQRVDATMVLKTDRTKEADRMGGQNRIVLDYGDMEELVLLAGINTNTGEIYTATNLNEWTGPVTEHFDYKTLAEALDAEPRKNAEGLVVRSLKTGGMVKLKQEDYIKLHRLVTGLNEKTVWEHLMTHDGKYDELLESLPDEFYDWVKGKADDLLFKHWAIASMSRVIFEKIKNVETRRDFATTATQYPEIRPYLFMLLDGKDISSAVWRSLKPKGETKMVEHTEDTA